MPSTAGTSVSVATTAVVPVTMRAHGLHLDMMWAHVDMWPMRWPIGHNNDRSLMFNRDISVLGTVISVVVVRIAASDHKQQATHNGDG
jgi:hypothetical protein